MSLAVLIIFADVGGKAAKKIECPIINSHSNIL
jgi:hypothetical protein